MSQGLNKIKRRLSSIRSTKKITKAMELVATIKLKKFKNLMLQGEAFSREIEDIMQDIASSNNEITSPFFNEFKEAKANLYIVINSNLGLCANYNSGLFKLIDKSVLQNDELIVIGQKGLTHYKLQSRTVDDSFVNLGLKLDAGEISEFSKNIVDKYLSGKYHAVKVVYVEYINSLSFSPTIFTLFPMKVAKSDKAKPLPDLPKFEPDINSIIDNLIPLYSSFLLHQLMLQSQVSEQASRRNAMENGAKNADELIDKLTIDYNKARQSIITQEIIEVVSGSNSI